MHQGNLNIVGGTNGSDRLSNYLEIKLPMDFMITPVKAEIAPDSTLLADVKKLLSEFPDVILCLEDGEIPVHSSLLATRSEFFKAMLFGEMSEGSLREQDPLNHLIATNCARLREVQIERIGTHTMLTVLHYICTDDLNETDPEILLSVLEASTRFLLPRLTSICSDSLLRVMNENSAARFLFAASKYGADALKERCLDYIARKANVIKADYSETLKVLLSQPDLVLELFLRKN